MTFSVDLARGGLVLTEWNASARQPVKRNVHLDSPLDVLRYWHYTVTSIVPDYTLDDLFSLLFSSPLLSETDLDRLSELLSCDMAAFVNEWRSTRSTSPDKDMTELVVSVIGQKNSYQRTEHIPGEVASMHEIYHDFSGRGPRTENYPGEYTEHPELESLPESYALDFTPLADILHIPLRYDPKLEIRSGIGEPPLATLYLPITLGELIHAIFWEIGFHGSPVERTERLDALKEQLEDIELDLATDAAMTEMGAAPSKIFKSSSELRESLESREKLVPPALRRAQKVLREQATNLCADPAVHLVTVEGAEEARIVVFVDPMAQTRDIPPFLDGVPVEVRNEVHNKSSQQG